MAEDKTKPEVREVEDTKPADEAAKEEKNKEGVTIPMGANSVAVYEEPKAYEEPKEEAQQVEKPEKKESKETEKKSVSSFEKALARRRGTRLQSTFNEVKAERQGVPHKGFSFEELKELRR